MFSRLRIVGLALLLTGLPAALALTGAPAFAQEGPEQPPPASPPPHDQVYRIKRNGREVFTNAGAVQVQGAQASAMELPELNTDLTAASPAQLQLLDNSVQRAHDELQQGARCQAIRASLRVPMRSFLLRGHVRELAVAASLLLMAVVLMTVWHGRLRSWMPLAPMLGCLYLGYATYVRVDHRLDALRDGLHACSSDLPPQGGDVDSVRTRLEQASSLQATIDRAYSRRAALADVAMRER